MREGEEGVVIPGTFSDKRAKHVKFDEKEEQEDHDGGGSGEGEVKYCTEEYWRGRYNLFWVVILGIHRSRRRRNGRIRDRCLRMSGRRR